jgi:hypothetical protein
MKLTLSSILSAGPLLICLVAHASLGEQIFKSGNAQVSLVELFTSEGCSSCPPADQFFSQLTGGNGLWNFFVPVAFHVDYWNAPWTDPLSSNKFTNRQSAYAAFRKPGESTLVTPDLVINGERSQAWDQISQLHQGNLVQSGALEVIHKSESQYIINFKPAKTETSEVVANLALLGFGITYQVTSGENAGKTLVHDFAALNLESTPLRNVNGVLTAIISLPPAKVNASNRGIAAWVSVRGRPIQATGGYL